jgi:endonuclease YncB( thermonuclease family)
MKLSPKFKKLLNPASKPFLTLILSFSLILNFFLLKEKVLNNTKEIKKTNGENRQVKVLNVIDGDTFELESRQRIRLRHIDAPELNLCGGQEAKEFLASLIQEKEVVLKEEVVGQQNRPLVLVYLNDKFINLEVLKNGWARYHSDSTTKTEILKQAGNKAKEERLGIFSPKCYSKTPDNPSCLIKGNIDKVTNKKTYYYPGCPQYNFTIVEKDIGENWFCSPKQAEEKGFNRAKNCPDYKN